MEQAIVRNVPGSGYDIANSTPNWPQDFDIFVLLPEVTIRVPTVSLHFRYFSKAWLSSPQSGYLVKLVVSDYDEFGRSALKTHCLWLSKDEYLARGLPFYISPLLEDKIIGGTDTLLNDNDFQKFPIHLTAQKTLERVLLNPQVSVTGNLYLQDAIARQFSFIDYALPDLFNPQVSIHTFLKKEDHELRKKHNLSFSLETKKKDPSMPWLNSSSSHKIIQQLARYLDNPLERKRIHQKLIHGEIEGKKLYVGMQKRFSMT
jgi:hypothetical protein